VLDVMMPKVDGLDVIRVLRAESDVLVLMLTARSTEDDLCWAWNLGADDYMTKPFSPRELVPGCARCCGGASARRSRTSCCGWAAVVDLARHVVTSDGQRVVCTRASSCC